MKKFDQNSRYDFPIIENWTHQNSKVLDLGCGDGSLLNYLKDKKDKTAIKFDTISFEDVLKKGLKVMDTTAFTLSQENDLPIIVFDMNKNGNLLKIISGQAIGTTVS